MHNIRGFRVNVNLLALYYLPRQIFPECRANRYSIGCDVNIQICSIIGRVGELTGHELTSTWTSRSKMKRGGGVFPCRPAWHKDYKHKLCILTAVSDMPVTRQCNNWRTYNWYERNMNYLQIMPLLTGIFIIQCINMVEKFNFFF